MRARAQNYDRSPKFLILIQKEHWPHEHSVSRHKPVISQQGRVRDRYGWRATWRGSRTGAMTETYLRATDRCYDPTITKDI